MDEWADKHTADKGYLEREGVIWQAGDPGLDDRVVAVAKITDYLKRRDALHPRSAVELFEVAHAAGLSMQQVLVAAACTVSSKLCITLLRVWRGLPEQTGVYLATDRKHLLTRAAAMRARAKWLLDNAEYLETRGQAMGQIAEARGTDIG